jgi:AcrR family transcriptional regulator
MGGTKERIVEAGAELFRRQGYTGTGVKQIVTSARAPFGSLYHFFPGGKKQLGTEVIRRSGGVYAQLVSAVWDAAPDAETGVRDVFAGAAETLRQTDYADACPIATVALEVASTNQPMRLACADVFESWIELASERFAAGGVEEPAARRLAIEMLMALEGAFLFSRALRSTEPLEIAGDAAVAAFRAALADDAGPA